MIYMDEDLIQDSNFILKKVNLFLIKRIGGSIQLHFGH